jgi:hypothetical protein
VDIFSAVHAGQRALRLNVPHHTYTKSLRSSPYRNDSFLDGDARSGYAQTLLFEGVSYTGPATGRRTVRWTIVLLPTGLDMKTLSKVALINIAWIIVSIASVVLIAPNMSPWMCGALVLVTLVVMNTALWGWLSGKRKNREVEGSRPNSTGTRNLIIAVLAFIATSVIAWMEWHVWRK